MRQMTDAEIQTLAEEAIRAALRYITLAIGAEPPLAPLVHDALHLAFDNCVRGALILKGRRLQHP